MDALAGDVVALVDSLGLDRFALGGHSMGGYVALRVAARASERLAALMLVGSRAAADTEEVRARRAGVALAIGATGSGPYLASFVPLLVGETTRRARPELLEGLHRMCDAAPEHVLVACQQGMARRPDSTELIRSLDVPVLVLQGEEDTFVSVSGSDDLALSVRCGYLATVPGAGHTPSVEQPRATADALLAFLRAARVL